MALFSTDWKNGTTHKQNGHDLLLPVEGKYVGRFQLRHYFFVRIPITGTGIGSRSVTRGFSYQLWDGSKVMFEQEVAVTLQVIYMASGMFGAPALSFVTYQPTKEVIRTKIINGEPTDEVQIINSATTSGKVQRYDGTDLTEEEIKNLVNPSWRHIFAGSRVAGPTMEFGNIILDTDSGVGTDEAILDGRWELPVYKQNVGPLTELDIVTDSLQAAGRADLYQFRFGGTSTPDVITATGDIFGGMGIGTAEQGTTVVRWGGEPFGHLSSRDVMPNTKQPSIMADKHHRMWVGVMDTEAGVYEERLSMDGGRRFKKLQHGTIYNGAITVAQEVIINPSTAERGAVLFQGSTLVFKRSGDNWASAVPIHDFANPEPFALTANNGVLRASNGKGILFVSRTYGATWRNNSVVEIK